MSKICKFLIVFLSLFFVACVEEEEYADNPQGNFEALWKIIDEHYCFFNEKGVDWDEVHQRYARQIDAEMSERQLFQVMANMIGELHDGHVNLYASFDVARYWSWHEDYPSNFSDSLLNRYLGTDYRIASGLKYRKLDDNIGYIYYGSFQSGVGNGNLDDVLFYLAPCQALIIDIRDNGGGNLQTAEKLAARFTNEERLVGYMQHKTGRGHNDFSKMEEQILKPSSGVRWQKLVVLLTNRQVFSAANEFVKYMKCMPNVIVVGDQTGGGSGLPFTSEMPNGWTVRFSACPMYDRNRQSTENGIQPDYRLDLLDEDFRRGRDTIIEFARSLFRH